ncbi:MAG: hypothetical protein WDA08_11150 [Weeksellaceae bacterium]|nr:hypothetical protein [Acholeplasmataceae bacterium]
MRNITLKILIILIFLTPIILFGQAEEQGDEFIKFLKGDGAFEKWFMELFTNLDTQINENAISASFLGRAIGGFGALIYLGWLGWNMQEGDAWRVTPMIRPIIIGLILINWTSFCNLIQAPLEVLASPSKAIFADIEDQVNDQRILRFNKQKEFVSFLYSENAKEAAKNKEADAIGQSSDKGWFAEKMADLFQPILEYQMRIKFEMQNLAANLIESIALTILRVCVYLIFFIQKVWAYILIILGPIAVGMSLIPGFENSFASWVAKFININLYTFIAYTIINIGQQLIMSGYMMEIQRYDRLMENGGDLTLIVPFLEQSGMIYTVMFPSVAYIVTGIGILITPTIADAIVTAGGAGVMSKIKSGMKTAVATAASIKIGGAAGAARSVGKANQSK